ncbi:hypothetical protein BJG93_35290 [Paraburkholderia sprentiae WSM5005]|uniref:Uncharacterized protein n=1 Tax=Paraburkholderia sprentiae WSM5005 TaxID=754502 RepID=A0A8F4KI58_9BURK|nr:hypothetical protein [Paraburkholderia sprentiae]QXE07123.1 hypothetical protein BJG93_35290 [Paraburkholderia sprentiae WSM5005]
MFERTSKAGNFCFVSSDDRSMPVQKNHPFAQQNVDEQRNDYGFPEYLVVPQVVG